MSMKIAHAFARTAMFCVLILFGLLLAPVVLLSGFVGGMPNQLVAPFVELGPLLKTLWASNPGAAMQVLMQQPLMVIVHGEPGSGAAVWRFFLYPMPLVVHLAVSVFAAVILCSSTRGATLRRLIALLPGMAVLVFVTTYVQVAACCTGGPRWALDVWLFSLAYNPLNTLIDWQQLYSRIEGALSIAQPVLALLGAALLATGVRRARDANADADPLRRKSG